MEGFRDFVTSDGFRPTCDASDTGFAEIAADDVSLMQFGFRLL